MPAEYECHMRSHLECGLGQTQRVRSLRNLLERERKDIWWVEPDGSNSEDVASDIAEAVEGGWHRPEKMLDLESPAIMPPTRVMCHQFSRLGSVDAILRTLGAHPIEETEITPEIIARWMALEPEQGGSS